MSTYKATIDLFSIPKIIAVKFGVVFNTDNNISIEEKKKWDRFKLISKFKYNNNEYLKLQPHPFLSVEIGDKKEYNFNMTFTLNRRDLFIFIMNLKEIINDFTKYPDLFMNENDEVIVNKDLSLKLRKVFRTTRKTLLIEHAPVLRGENDNLITYEGVIFAINHLENYTTLTYNELRYLLWEFERIDMTALALQLISIDSTLTDEDVKDISVKPPIAEIENEEIVDTKSSFFVRNKPTIPNI